MNNLRKTNILAVLILLSICSVLYSQQDEQVENQLQFTISDESYESIHIGGYPETAQSTHIAIIEFTNEIHLHQILNKPSFNLRMIDIGSGWRYHLSTRSISTPEEDLDFWLLQYIDNDVYQEYDLFSIPNLEENLEGKYLLLADSEQEARELTEAFIEICNKAASENLENLKKELAETRNIIVEGPNTIIILQAELKVLEKKLEEKKEEYAIANYIDANQVDINHIINAMREFSLSLKTVDFELVGLDAKIESINKYKQSDMIIDDDTLIKLNQILMTTDIERAGALARKEAYKTAFDQARELCILFERRVSINDLIDSWRIKLNEAQDNLPIFEQRVKNPPAYAKPIEVENNTVVIRPISQD